MKHIYLSLPYLIPFVVLFFNVDVWFLPHNKIILSFTLGFFFLFQASALIFEQKLIDAFKKINKPFSHHFWVLILIYILFVFSFPIRNMNWGDGLLLLETNVLETKLFGFQFTLDEIGETVVHSFFSRFLNLFGFGDDPRYSYSFLSNIAGAIVCFFLLWEVQKKSILNKFGIFFILASGGFLLFFGYAENYTLVTAIHFFLYYFISKGIRENREVSFLLYVSTALVSLGILFHLVSGYLVIFLFYLWLKKSPQSSKLKHLLVCTGIGTLILLPTFLYFIFFHSPGTDVRSTHLVHPPFYPILRLISINHVKEILSVLYFNAGVSLFYLGYIFFFYRNEWRVFFSKEENIILCFGILSFGLHGFFHNPQLGFPADWDLMGFYWLPISYLSFKLWLETKTGKIEFLPVLIFSIISIVLTAIQLNKETPKKELVYQLTESLINDYVAEEKETVLSLNRSDQKFYAKGDFLFFKAERMTNFLCPFEGQSSITNRMAKHRMDWQAGFKENTFDKATLPIFLQEATKTNIDYIKALEEYTICHQRL